jgi:hypothetical protein
MTDYPYPPELPWGCWMRTATGPGGNVTVVDEKGRHWQSLRDAFWSGRLRMSGSNLRIRDEQLELMLAALASKNRGIVFIEEQTHSVFAGDHQYMRFWWYWMYAEGLTDGGFRRDPLDAKVSAEGVAVLRMLAATRPIELNTVPIGRAAVEMLGQPGSPDECDRAKFEAAEASARLLPLVFVREQAFGSEAISLLHRDPKDVIPVARTIWHMAWPDARMRDRAFLWMANRSDLWTSWGEMVLGDGAEALTQHLLVLLLAGDADRPASDTSDSPGRGSRLSLTHDI